MATVREFECTGSRLDATARLRHAVKEQTKLSGVVDDVAGTEATAFKIREYLPWRRYPTASATGVISESSGKCVVRYRNGNRIAFTFLVCSLAAWIGATVWLATLVPDKVLPLVVGIVGAGLLGFNLLGLQFSARRLDRLLREHLRG